MMLRTTHIDRLGGMVFPLPLKNPIPTQLVAYLSH